MLAVTLRVLVPNILRLLVPQTIDGIFLGPETANALIKKGHNVPKIPSTFWNVPVLLRLQRAWGPSSGPRPGRPPLRSRGCSSEWRMLFGLVKP